MCTRLTSSIFASQMRNEFNNLPKYSIPFHVTHNCHDLVVNPKKFDTWPTRRTGKPKQITGTERKPTFSAYYAEFSFPSINKT